jgi:hypothetical protein
MEMMMRIRWMTWQLILVGEVQNFYRLLAASKEKVHNGTDVTVLQAVSCLVAFKLKYNFLNQCYNDIMKLIIDLIPVKHSMPKDLN